MTLHPIQINLAETKQLIEGYTEPNSGVKTEINERIYQINGDLRTCDYKRTNNAWEPEALNELIETQKKWVDVQAQWQTNKTRDDSSVEEAAFLESIKADPEKCYLELAQEVKDKIAKDHLPLEEISNDIYGGNPGMTHMAFISSNFPHTPQKVRRLSQVFSGEEMKVIKKMNMFVKEVVSLDPNNPDNHEIKQNAHKIKQTASSLCYRSMFRDACNLLEAGREEEFNTILASEPQNEADLREISRALAECLITDPRSYVDYESPDLGELEEAQGTLACFLGLDTND